MDDGSGDETNDSAQLQTLKALGDNTRYALYLELARSPEPLGTADLSTRLGLHPNTVRPHLERMRDVGLLVLHVDARGGVGRPQHLYGLAPDAPALGLEPSPFPTLSSMLLRMAASAGLAREDAVDAGREQGQVDARRAQPGPCIAAVTAELRRLGFDPETAPGGDDLVTIGFAHCPYRSLAETNPEVVCGLHEGMVAGFVDAYGGHMVSFRSLVDRDPCQVDLRVPTLNIVRPGGTP